MEKIISLGRENHGKKSKRFIESPNYQVAHLELIKEYNDLQKEIQIYSSSVNKHDNKTRKELAMTVMKLIELEEIYAIANEGEAITV